MAIYEFGAPLLTRTSEIASKCASSKTLFPLEVMGKYQRLKQITVRIGVPVYRMQNGRTRTFQKEYLATHSDVAADLFTLDPESVAAQKAQHTILQKLAEDEDLYKEFSGGTQQTEPIIVTSTGVVVNGNRRLCVCGAHCLRKTLPNISTLSISKLQYCQKIVTKLKFAH